jgi:hypothetical protein
LTRIEKFEIRAGAFYTLVYRINESEQWRCRMLPPIADPRWNRLLTGAIQHQFRSVPAGLMFARLRRSLESDGSADNRQKSLKEAYDFFQKYEKILADDIAAIFS